MKTKNQKPPRAKRADLHSPAYQTFLQHLHELRRRLFYVAASVVLWGLAAYGVQQSIVGWLLKPAHGQKFIYTSPAGGINFLFQLCLDIGLVCSLPVIIYHALRFIQPAVGDRSLKPVIKFSLWSGFLALLGVSFGYFLGLPAAMGFLTHQFTTSQIQPLLTIQSYMSFVTWYLFATALLFQVPLILMFINRIKPFRPKRLLQAERYVIVGIFIIAAIVTPTPDIMNQLIVAVPMILSYQVGVLLIWHRNRHLLYRERPRVRQLADQDAARQADRQARRGQLAPLVSATQLRRRESALDSMVTGRLQLR